MYLKSNASKLDTQKAIRFCTVTTRRLLSLQSERSLQKPYQDARVGYDAAVLQRKRVSQTCKQPKRAKRGDMIPSGVGEPPDMYECASFAPNLSLLLCEETLRNKEKAGPMGLNVRLEPGRLLPQGKGGSRMMKNARQRDIAKTRPGNAHCRDDSRWKGGICR